MNTFKFKRKFLDLFFPRQNRCVFCNAELDERQTNCTCFLCQQNLPFVKNECPRCGVGLNEEDKGACIDCARNNYQFDVAKCVFDYEGNVLAAVHRFKYSALKFYAQPLAEYLCKKLAEWQIAADMVCFVPMHPNKFKTRGYNQAQLLAEIVAQAFDLPCLELVLKVKETPSQASLSFFERRANVKDCYKFNAQFKNEVLGKNILLIDDVFTTGATSSEIAGELKAHGAAKVFVLTLAHTKLKKEA